MIIEIDISKIPQLVEEGSGLAFETPEAEQALIDLLEMKDRIDQAVEQVKTDIHLEIEKIDPHAAGIHSDRIRIQHSPRGAKFYLDQSKLAKLPKKFYKVKETFSVDSKEVEKFEADTGTLPDGINRNKRERTVSLSLKGDAAA